MRVKQLLLTLLLLMTSLGTFAESFVKQAVNYTCYVAGKNILQFNLPTFDYYSFIVSNVHVTSESYVEATVDGVTRRIIEWCHPGKDPENQTWVKTSAAGTLIVQMAKYGKADIEINANDGWKDFVLGADANDNTHYTTTVQWKVPYEWQGKNIQLKLHVHWDDIGSGSFDKVFDSYDSPAPPDVMVNLMDPMLSYDKEHVGDIVMPFYIQAQKCTKLDLHYTDAITSQETVLPQTPALSGNVFVPMDRPLKDVYLQANLIDTDKNNLIGIKSQGMVVNHLHTPKKFQTELKEDGSVLLTWEVDNAEFPDISTDDFWDIQRNTTGTDEENDRNWRTIGQIDFQDRTTNFQFLDDELLDFYEGQKVAYRIRRTSTAIWDWGSKAGAMYATMGNRICLKHFHSPEVVVDEWNEDTHSVIIKWKEYKEETKGYENAACIWDDRAKLLVNVKMTGQNGHEYTETIDLSREDEAIKNMSYKYNLTRPCVTYDFQLVTIRDKSPLVIYGILPDIKTYYPDTDGGLLPVEEFTYVDSIMYMVDANHPYDGFSFVNLDTPTDFHATERQASVLLEWNSSGGEHDYYRILRKDHADSTAQWDTIATDIAQTIYEDKSVLPQVVYDYKVESVFQCEGVKTNEATTTGHCAFTGMVRGYLKLPDGTGLGGYTVKAVPQDTKSPNAVTKTAVTDDTGFFEIGGLFYDKSGTYKVMLDSDGATFSVKEQVVYFDNTTNLANNIMFYADTYYVYSGAIHYKGTSIPVQGVNFKVDGNIVNTPNGTPVATNSQGEFELSIPKGLHEVQAVKDGHVFENDGFLINPDAEPGKEREWYWNANKYEARLWDESLVTLHGRVVGGDYQGSMELGKSRSVNNLGDSLKIVLQLEGDNASYIVMNLDDPNQDKRQDTYQFGLNKQNQTVVNSTRHSITVLLDQQTGEYELKLYPVKYKVVEISAQGYPTLFQEGKVGETLDLTFYANGDTAVYNRIYHSVPTLDITQFNPRNEKYYGVKQCIAQDNIGNKDTVRVWSAADDSYAFGHPVFMAGSPYGWILQACEKYYYNNEPQNKLDIVNLNGGTVVIRNNLVSATDEQTIKLDENGGASYVFTPQNTTFVLENDLALKSVGITLEYDSTFYDVKPFKGGQLKGFVMATVPKPEGKVTVSAGLPKLFEILRDPPGSGSSAYLEAGSKLSYTYNASLDASAGFKLVSEKAVKQSYYTGTVVVPSFGATGVEYGTMDGASKKNTFALDIVTKFGGSWTFNYNFDVTERIQTNSGKKWVGPKADLFIGVNENVVVMDAIAVRVVPESQYKILSMGENGSFLTEDGVKVKVPYGAVKKLAEGKDAEGNKVYLVRDEVIGVGPKVQSTFVHSQHYIENELIPNLLKIRNSLIVPKDSDQYAQQLADYTGMPVYVSSVDKSDPEFGLKYKQVNPSDIEKNDSVDALNRQIATWAKFLIQNEQEKLEVRQGDLIKNYDFDGGSSVQYSETFSTGLNETRYLKWPILGDAGLGVGTLEGLIGNQLEKLIDKVVTKGDETTYGEGPVADNQKNLQIIKAGTAGTELTLKLLPVLNFTFNDKNSVSDSQSKKIGFTLSLSSKASLNVDVYRTRSTVNDMDTLENAWNHDAFYNLTVKNLNMVRKGINVFNPTSYLDLYKTPVYSNIVYRTRGGATCSPYEDERLSKWFNPGQVIDAKTKQIDKLRIWADQPTVSNVPFDEPARFTLHLANETDMPEQATEIFTYFLADVSNLKGAKIVVDGVPLGGTGESIYIPAYSPIVTKHVELYPSAEFDYENVGVSLYDINDPTRITTAYLTAHFVPTAGKVRISTPGDKWVINTESAYDSKLQQYYMPVKIDGFDVNYRNFDHIELQYKLSTQGDKDWVNVCSYYADRELMKKASGVCDTIPGNGTIIAKFVGEGEPIEQRYDIRAVSFCRHGNGFLTASSDILTGIKDTRKPELFGTPKPINGILGIGDDIQFNFSETIAANYLKKINNFEVLGTPLKTDISLSTALNFTGQNAAYSLSRTNLSGKNFTVDVMINPVKSDKNQAVFSHGDDHKNIVFGVTPDNRLIAMVNDSVCYSEQSVDFNALHQVAYAVNQDNGKITITFFDGNRKIGTSSFDGVYEGSDFLKLGGDYFLYHEGNENWKLYQGEMLEFRLWNRTLTEAEMNANSNKVLSGHEHGLLTYYHLNEGNGDISYDNGAAANDLELSGQTWKLPQGISMKFDGDEGVRLNPALFDRTEHEDFTLMLWFRPDGTEGTIMSNGQAEGETDYDKHFFLGMEGVSLCFKTAGYRSTANPYVELSQWHHVAVTVSRSRNVANIYLDQKLIDSFPADSVGAISGNNLAIGATLQDDLTWTKPFTGHIDEVAMFSSVLPLNMIKTFASQTPSGKESMLLAYLNFAENGTLSDNTKVLQPTGVSLKRYFDNQGNEITLKKDTIADYDAVARHMDKTYSAPMTRTALLDNIKYSFVADGNKLLINLDVPDADIEKTNVYVTVRDVADLNGNLLPSPITSNIYVYRSPIRWSLQHVSKNLHYGEGCTFTVDVQNLSGQDQYFTIEDLPVWISASETTGIVSALDSKTITFTVSPYINIGNYDEILSISSDNNMYERIKVDLTVRGDEPIWAVSDELKMKNQTMQIVARVRIKGVIAADKDDILAVFGPNQEVMGVSHLEIDNSANENSALAYVVVYGYPREQTSLSFRFYDASTGLIYQLQPEEEMLNADFTGYIFRKDEILGTAENPIELTNMIDEVTTLQLEPGWNWISLNAVPLREVTVGELLYGASQWQPGDQVEIVNGKVAMQFYCVAEESERGYRWTQDSKKVTLNPRIMYRFYSVNKKKAYIGGTSVIGLNIDLRHGWNRIAYVSKINLPIAQAMSGYLPNASAGDVLKSQDKFAMLSSDGAGGLIWKGDLQYLETGKGYMLKRNAKEDAIFEYPIYYTDNRYSGIQDAPARRNVHATSMNIVASVTGVELQEGDSLVAYCGADKAGVALPDEEGYFYLNIGADEELPSQLSFCIERDGEPVAVNRSKITYQADKVLGSPENPTEINFAQIDEMATESGAWYTISGIKLNGKPKEKGLYIYNGKVILNK